MGVSEGVVGYFGPSLGRLRNLESAIARFGSSVDTYGVALTRGDDLADAFAADCQEFGRAKGMVMFNLMLSGEPSRSELKEMPDSLRDLFAQIDDTPGWMDAEQLELGASVFCRHAREAGLALGTTSLVSGYRSSAAARPLFITGRYGPELARLRSYETARWIFATVRPGGLSRDSEGFARTVRVRLIHAFVRQHILQSGMWDSQELGMPINQADLAFTAIEFSLLPIRAMQDLGIHFTATELDAIYAMWRYMGHLIGLDEDVLVIRDGDVQKFELLRHATSPGPDDDCREFVRILLDDVMVADLRLAKGALGVVGRRNGRELMHGLTRAFVGDVVADELAIDDNLWKHLPRAVKPLMALKTRALRISPRLQARSVRRNLKEIDEVLDATARFLGIEHDLVDADPHRAR